jgi:hypothetical protein
MKYCETHLRHFWQKSTNQTRSAGKHFKMVNLKNILFCNSLLKLTFALHVNSAFIYSFFTIRPHSLATSDIHEHQARFSTSTTGRRTARFCRNHSINTVSTLLHFAFFTFPHLGCPLNDINSVSRVRGPRNAKLLL